MNASVFINFIYGFYMKTIRKIAKVQVLRISILKEFMFKSLKFCKNFRLNRGTFVRLYRS